MAEKPKPTKEPGRTPTDRRLPLASAMFRYPVPIPGCDHRASLLVSGEAIAYSESAKCPQLFLDPDLRVICIGDVLVPFDGATVLSVVRAKMAKG